MLPVQNVLRAEYPLHGKVMAKLDLVSVPVTRMGGPPSAVCHSAVSLVCPKCEQRVLAARVLLESTGHTDADLSTSLPSF